MDKIKLLKDLRRDAETIEYNDHSAIDKFKQRFRMIIRSIFGEDSHYLNDFKRLSFAPPKAVLGSTGSGYELKSRTLGRDGIINLIDTILEEISLTQEAQANTRNAIKSERNPRNRIFIIHGHDETAKITLARFLERLDLEAVILHEMPNKGKTIIEKFEEQAAEVSYAIALLTPDDVAHPKNNEKEVQLRARQNVIFELGYFCGVLRRKNVCILYKEGVEIPSDYAGIVYITMDDRGAWQVDLAREMIHAGLDIDFNKVLSRKKLS